MENEFIPYKQSLALKESGFDELCFAIHNYVDGELNFMYVNNFHLNNDINELSATAPLYQQAFRWFREKYKKHFNIQEISRKKWFFDIFDIDCKIEDIDIITSKNFKTYEEAELECLKKLIEIVKNKQNV